MLQVDRLARHFIAPVQSHTEVPVIQRCRMMLLFKIQNLMAVYHEVLMKSIPVLYHLLILMELLLVQIKAQVLYSQRSTVQKARWEC